MASKGNKGNQSKSQQRANNKTKENDLSNLAKRQRESDFEVDPNKTLKFDKWEQQPDFVTIILFAGKRLSSNDIDVEYREQEVRISLTDGRRWFCRFYQHIDAPNSRVQLQKLKIILKIKKAVAKTNWPGYEFVENEPVEAIPAASAKVEPKPTSSTPSKKETKITVEEPETTEHGLSNGDLTEDVQPKHALVSKGLGMMLDNMDEAPEKAESINNGEESKKPEPELELSHVKNDFYERDSSTMVVAIYVKGVNKNTTSVKFGTRDFEIKFQSSDPKFLALNAVTDKNAIFRWGITVVDDIVPERCKTRVTGTSVELTLAKADPRKWGALEASQARGALVPPSTSDWQPATESVLRENATTTVSDDDLSSVTVRGSRASTVTSTEVTDHDNRPSTSGAGRVHTDSGKDGVSQKPTCMVSPLKTGSDEGLDFGLGLTGLDNLGNTCFMNSVLQVLINTPELRDYFLSSAFQKEINTDNPLGMQGKLAVAFAMLLKMVWSGKHRSYAPTKLKQLVAMKNSQFMGFAQHDSQEFLAFLLDGLHEDLNRIRQKPYTEDVDSEGRPDESVANEAWRRHKLRNDSFVVDLFQGQYKSKLVCPVCKKVSITFDPFMHLSVPLPKKKNRLLSIIFMSRDPYKKPVKYWIRLAKDARVEDLKEAVFQKTGVRPAQMRVFESYKNKIQSLFHNGSSLATVQPTDKIYVCEVLSAQMAGDRVIEIAVIQRTLHPVFMPSKCSNCKRECGAGEKLKRCTKCLKTAYCNQPCQKQDWSRHRPTCIKTNELVGQPFIVSLPRSQATFSRLAQTLQAFSRYSLNVFQPPVSTAPHTISSSGDSDPCVTPSDPCLTPTDPCVTPECSVDSSGSQSLSSSQVTTATVTDTPTGSDVSTPDLPASSSATSHATSGDTVIPATSVSDLPSTSTSSTSLASSRATVIPTASGSGLPDLPSASSSSDLSCSSDSSQATSTTEVASSSSQSSDSSFVTVGEESPVPAARPQSFTVGDERAGEDPPRAPPQGYVVGRPQDVPTELPFSIRQCSKDGKGIPGEEGHKLVDKGDEPLNLDEVAFIAMDWKNAEKCTPYVLVESKNIEYEEDEREKAASAEESGPITLDQCLSLFTEPEVLSPDHAWYCPRCKEHREATKQLSIWRLPAYLIIQLKRFSFSSFIWRDKIDKLVDFPVSDLDLSKHFIGKLPSTEPPPIYDLYGVVNHMGGILGGHYTSYARCPDKSDHNRNEVGWRLFDDSMVSESREGKVVTRAGYVLFYKRRDMAVTVPEADEPAQEATAADKQTDKMAENGTEHVESRESENPLPSCSTLLFPEETPGSSQYPCTDMDTVD